MSFTYWAGSLSSPATCVLVVPVIHTTGPPWLGWFHVRRWYNPFVCKLITRATEKKSHGSSLSLLCLELLPLNCLFCIERSIRVVCKLHVVLHNVHRKCTHTVDYQYRFHERLLFTIPDCFAMWICTSRHLKTMKWLDSASPHSAAEKSRATSSQRDASARRGELVDQLLLERWTIILWQDRFGDVSPLEYK